MVIVAIGGIALAASEEWVAGGKHAQRTFTDAHIRRVAKIASDLDGWADPTRVASVRSSYGRAISVLSHGRQSGEEDAAVPVEVITMHGHFTARNGNPPPGIGIPRGLWLTVIMNLATGEPMETLLTDRRPELGVLGRVREIEQGAEVKQALSGRSRFEKNGRT